MNHKMYNIQVNEVNTKEKISFLLRNCSTIIFIYKNQHIWTSGSLFLIFLALLGSNVLNLFFQISLLRRWYRGLMLGVLHFISLPAECSHLEPPLFIRICFGKKKWLWKNNNYAPYQCSIDTTLLLLLSKILYLPSLLESVYLKQSVALPDNWCRSCTTR